MDRLLYVSLGAVLGANARYLISLWAAERLGAFFPFGTMIVNITGCFLIGLINGLGEAGLDINPALRLLFTVGFIGSFTTFSTFGYESINLLRADSMALALLNILVNVVVGLLAVVLGLYSARIFQ